MSVEELENLAKEIQKKGTDTTFYGMVEHSAGPFGLFVNRVWYPSLLNQGFSSIDEAKRVISVLYGDRELVLHLYGKTPNGKPFKITASHFNVTQ